MNIVLLAFTLDTAAMALPLKVLHINNTDLAGRRFNGYDLIDDLKPYGVECRQLVLEKKSTSPAVSEILNTRRKSFSPTLRRLRSRQLLLEYHLSLGARHRTPSLVSSCRRCSLPPNPQSCSLNDGICSSHAIKALGLDMARSMASYRALHTSRTVRWMEAWLPAVPLSR